MVKVVGGCGGMAESEDDYDYTREVAMPSEDEDEDLMQDVLAKLLECLLRSILVH